MTGHVATRMETTSLTPPRSGAGGASLTAGGHGTPRGPQGAVSEEHRGGWYENRCVFEIQRKKSIQNRDCLQIFACFRVFCASFARCCASFAHVCASFARFWANVARRCEKIAQKHAELTQKRANCAEHAKIHENHNFWRIFTLRFEDVPISIPPAFVLL